MARLRSPNFPATNLQDAVKVVQSIYDKNRKAVIMREDAAKDVGYSGLTGRSLQVLGALVQYDLLENTSKGECRVTQIAENILHGIPEETKKEALRKAGHAPTLFQAIFDRFEGEIPGENAVRSFLIQNGFTNDGADKALKNFLSTIRFLEENGVFEESDNGGDEPASEAVPDGTGPNVGITDPPSVVQNPPAGGQLAGETNLDFNLSSSGLVLAGGTNSATELQAFIKKLEALVLLLPDE
uniref:hypothetical protein n=1 Tax=Parerythrobacter lutipelagi TaxID=1964208 RepID=UPI0010F5FD5D|nr:hypothetical protein [Parerythrobacter lutipelagi]